LEFDQPQTPGYYFHLLSKAQLARYISDVLARHVPPFPIINFVALAVGKSGRTGDVS
jgi:hypothetical protein